LSKKKYASEEEITSAPRLSAHSTAASQLSSSTGDSERLSSVLARRKDAL